MKNFINKYVGLPQSKLEINNYNTKDHKKMKRKQKTI